jgi:hypothetical protein
MTTTNFPSPDGRFCLQCLPVEMRMSHWLALPRLVESATQTVLLDLTATLWSAQRFQWVDGSHLLLELRCYPGDVPLVVATIDLLKRAASVRSPGRGGSVLLKKLPDWLQNYAQDQNNLPAAERE